MTPIPEFSVRTVWGMLTLPALEIENKARMLEAFKHPSFEAILKHEEYICHALNEHSNIEAREISDALFGKGSTVDGYVCKTFDIEWSRVWSWKYRRELFSIRLAWCMHIANELEKRL